MKSNHQLKIILLVIFLAIALPLAFRVRNSDTGQQESIVIPAPTEWRELSREDTLVRGLCLGSASECGHIRIEYSSNATKEKAMEAVKNTLKGQDWTISEVRMVRNELQMSAKKDKKYISVRTYGDHASLNYEENHIAN
jgi:hypothetical protein